MIYVHISSVYIILPRIGLVKRLLPRMLSQALLKGHLLAITTTVTSATSGAVSSAITVCVIKLSLEWCTGVTFSHSHQLVYKWNDINTYSNIKGEYTLEYNNNNSIIPHRYQVVQPIYASNLQTGTKVDGRRLLHSLLHRLYVYTRS